MPLLYFLLRYRCEKASFFSPDSVVYARSLAECYLWGKGLEENQPMATKLLARAANVGIDDAQYMLALCLLGGMGCSQNNEAGRKWILAAVSQGHKKAVKFAGEWIGDGPLHHSIRAAARLALARLSEGYGSTHMLGDVERRGHDHPVRALQGQSMALAGEGDAALEKREDGGESEADQAEGNEEGKEQVVSMWGKQDDQGESSQGKEEESDIVHLLGDRHANGEDDEEELGGDVAGGDRRE